MSSALEILWIEKYRPRSLKEIVNQEDIVKRLMKFVEEKNMPHLLFAGPAGTGKTTAAHALARDLYGEGYRQYILELNASVSKNTPILVRRNNRIMRIRFEDLDKMYFKNKDEVIKYGDGEYVGIDDLEVLTVDKETGKVEWRRATWLIRHKVSKILRVRLEGGGIIELTGNHSVMVIGESGGLVEKSAKDLKPGDYLISFVSKVEEDMGGHSPRRVKEVSATLARLLGLYAAEANIAAENGSLGPLSSSQLVPALSHSKGLATAQLARFNKDTVYGVRGAAVRDKRVPTMVYGMPVQQRIEFLKGLHHRDGAGVWGEASRITSTSQELLTDIAWLARISGIESMLRGGEVHLIWKGARGHGSSDLIHAAPFIKFLEEVSHAVRADWRYELGNRTHDGGAVSKSRLLQVLNAIDDTQLTEEQRERLGTLRRLASSDLHAVRIASIEVVDYNDYVYDVSVPGNNMFFAGSIPILLHNSDERGINVIREKVKEFARSRTPPGVPFKIIILDEADNMTSDAQQALRRLMELYSSSTRFILIANYPSKIIDPIQSRCAFFRFQPLKKEDVVARLRYIAEREGVDYDDEALETIYEVSEGDMRKAINILQSSAALGKVTVETVFKVIGLARPKEVREMIKTALSGNFEAARNMLRKIMIEYGLSGEDVVKQIHKEIFGNELKISEENRVLIADYLGEIHYRLVEGSDDDIQLTAFLAWLSLLGRRAS